MVGNPAIRVKSARSLENAAQTIETLFGEFISAEPKGSHELAGIGRLPISSVVSELRFYIRCIKAAELLQSDTEIRTAEELAKYLLTSYVHEMTGDFRDRHVSVLIEDLTSSEYSEEAHRMWRFRNYKRLETHFSWITRFFVAASVVIAHTT
jgi:hypothetical protein